MNEIENESPIAEDEKSLFPAPALGEDLPLPSEDGGDGEAPQTDGDPADPCPCDEPCLRDPPQTDSDPPQMEGDGSGDGDGVTEPTKEIERLRAELEECQRDVLAMTAKLEEQAKTMERMGRECEEFRTLFPDVALSSVPDRVWEDVKNGVPLSAAFALSERRRIVGEREAARMNAENQARSSGSLCGVENDFFSPQEVRAMSQEEVRANFQKIMRSMPKWQ